MGAEDVKAMNWMREQKIKKVAGETETIKNKADAKAEEAKDAFNKAHDIIDKSSHLKEKIDKAEEATKKWKKVSELVSESTEKLKTLQSSSESKNEAEEADIARLNAKMGELEKEYENTKEKLERRLGELRTMTSDKVATDAGTQAKEATLKDAVEKTQQLAEVSKMKGADLEKQVNDLKKKLLFVEGLKKTQDEHVDLATTKYRKEEKKLNSRIDAATAHIAELKAKSKALHAALDATTK